MWWEPGPCRPWEARWAGLTAPKPKSRRGVGVGGTDFLLLTRSLERGESLIAPSSPFRSPPPSSPFPALVSGGVWGGGADLGLREAELGKGVVPGDHVFSLQVRKPEAQRGVGIAQGHTASSCLRTPGPAASSVSRRRLPQCSGGRAHTSVHRWERPHCLPPPGLEAPILHTHFKQLSSSCSWLQLAALL